MTEYKLYWIEETGRGGVGLMVKHDLVESVMEVRRVSPRIISIDIVVNEKVVTVISVYAPQRGRSKEEKQNSMKISLLKYNLDTMYVLC